MKARILIGLLMLSAFAASADEIIDLGDPVFVPVPGGCFVMGSDRLIPPDITMTASRIGVRVYLNEDEQPRHKVCVTPFEIGIYPVTAAQWQRVMGGPLPDNPNLPATGITWYGAREYARRLGAQRNDGYVYRLPTEAEWQYACTGGKEAPEKIDAMELEGKYRYWRSTPIDVDTYPPGPFGIYGMMGNVWEWTASDYLPYSAARHWIYAPNPDAGTQKVYRGGSHASAPDFISCARRGHGWPDESVYTVGFRLVRTRSNQ